jgi:hypothetical protein
VSARVRCPSCGGTDHRAYTKGKRRFRVELLPGNVASRGRECPCGHLFLELAVPMDEPLGMDLWRASRDVARNGSPATG